MKRVPKKITVKMLVRWGACGDGVDILRREFGESAAFTPGNVYVLAQSLCRSSLMTEWLLEKLSPEDVARVRRSHDQVECRAGRCNWMWEHAAALCRLARQNLPKNRSLAA